MAGREMNPKLKLDRIHGDMLEVYDIEFIKVQSIDWIGVEPQGCSGTSDFNVTIKATSVGSNTIITLARYAPWDYLAEDEKRFIKWIGHAFSWFHGDGEIGEAQDKARRLVLNAEVAAEKEARDDLLAFITAISSDEKVGELVR